MTEQEYITSCANQLCIDENIVEILIAKYGFCPCCYYIDDRHQIDCTLYIREKYINIIEKLDLKHLFCWQQDYQNTYVDAYIVKTTHE